MQHHWDVFWIEIVLYASQNDLLEVKRVHLQRHMEDWSARNMADPAPSVQEIRKKIRKLWDTLERVNNARN